tara:strand:- start:403 stop:666 length:264 start_codon:yes stop_codon:yes gene_type:complete
LEVLADEIGDDDLIRPSDLKQKLFLDLLKHAFEMTIVRVLDDLYPILKNLIFLLRRFAKADLKAAQHSFIASCPNLAGKLYCFTNRL